MSDPNLSFSDFDKLRRSKGLIFRGEEDWYSKIDRFKDLQPYSQLFGSKEVIFFTKPDLHLFENYNPSYLNKEIQNVAFFKEALRRYPGLLQQLQLSMNGNKTPFIPLLQNAVKSSLEMPSSTSDIVETSSTVFGTNIAYKHKAPAGEEGFDFSLEFEDSKYLEVYTLLKIMDEYAKKKNLITPPNDSYTVNKILHDQFSIYKFILDEDFETIIYYAKYYGVFSKSLPREVFGNLNSDGGISYSVDFHASFVDDWDPQILVDFNDLTSKYFVGYDNIPLYDNELCAINGDWANIAYVEYYPNPDNIKIPLYKLKWR